MQSTAWLLKSHCALPFISGVCFKNKFGSTPLSQQVLIWKFHKGCHCCSAQAGYQPGKCIAHKVYLLLEQHGAESRLLPLSYAEDRNCIQEQSLTLHVSCAPRPHLPQCQVVLTWNVPSVGSGGYGDSRSRAVGNRLQGCMPTRLRQLQCPQSGLPQARWWQVFLV